MKIEKWFNELQKRRRVLITDRLEFFKYQLERLTNILKEYEEKN